MPSDPGPTAAAPPSPPGRLDRLDRALSRRAAVDWPHPRWFTWPLGGFSLSANYGILWYVLCLLPWLFGAPPTAVEGAVRGGAGHPGGGDRASWSSATSARARPPVADPTQPEQIPLPLSKSFPSSHASMAVVGTFTLGDAVPAVRSRRSSCWRWCCASAACTSACTTSATCSAASPTASSGAPPGSSSSRRRCDVGALSTRGGQLAVAAAAVLVIVIGLAAAGAFDGCRGASTQERAAVRRRVRLRRTAASPTPRPRCWRRAWASGPRTRGARSTRASSSPAPSSSTATSRAPRSSSPTRGGRRIHSANIIAVKEGDSAKRLIVGAHYDSARRRPGLRRQRHRHRAAARGRGARQERADARTPSCSSPSAPRRTGALGSQLLPAHA